MQTEQMGGARVRDCGVKEIFLSGQKAQTSTG